MTDAILTETLFVFVYIILVYIFLDKSKNNKYRAFFLK